MGLVHVERPNGCLCHYASSSAAMSFCVKSFSSLHSSFCRQKVASSSSGCKGAFASMSPNRDTVFRDPSNDIPSFLLWL